MDIVSHGLWGGVLFGRSNRRLFFYAILFGILPDLLSFGVFTMARLLGFAGHPSFGDGAWPSVEAIPAYVHWLYNITHSLFVFMLVLAILWFLARTYMIPFLAYGFAILIDIPTHPAEYFGTPFLWPFSAYRFDGVSWGEPVVFLLNVSLLIFAFVLWYLRKPTAM